jgi:hypothetical protein
MAYIPDATDPFSGGEKLPSLSWKGLPIGSTFTLEVLEPAKALQSTNFETGELDFWDAEKQRPKMAAVLNVHVIQGPHSIGEDRSIWAQIPSNLFIALKEAQKAADARFGPGGTLHLRFTGEEPHKNPRFNAIKQYQAKYEPPTESAQADPFAKPAQKATPQAPPAQSQAQGWSSAPPKPAAKSSGWR